MPDSPQKAYTFANAVRGQYCNFLVSRAYRRVRMRLPARLRWSSPLGQKIELAETMDVSRGGLLVSSKELHAPGGFFRVFQRISCKVVRVAPVQDGVAVDVGLWRAT